MELARVLKSRQVMELRFLNLHLEVSEWFSLRSEPSKLEIDISQKTLHYYFSSISI